MEKRRKNKKSTKSCHPEILTRYFLFMVPSTDVVTNVSLGEERVSDKELSGISLLILSSKDQGQGGTREKDKKRIRKRITKKDNP